MSKIDKQQGGKSDATIRYQSREALLGPLKEASVMTSERPRYRVLLIDDDPTLTTPLQEALELLAHYRVLVAHDGASGLESLFAHRPDCVVVDILMPGLDGYQFLRAVRGDPATAEVPLV